MSSSPPAANGSWVETFPGNMVWSNATLMTKGMAHYNAVAMGEIDVVCERLRVRQSEPDAWRQEWCAMGDHVQAQGDAAEAAGHPLTAANYWLRAGMYWFTAERFVEPGEQKRAIGEKALQLQQAGLLRRHPTMEKVEVPYEGGTLPGLFLKAPGATGRVPTIVLFDGMDNCKEMSVLFAGLEFARRGWNTLAIDGPGQGESLRLRGLYARHDYEVAGRAAYDWVAARPDVDADRVVVMGYSFGGYYAGRVAAMDTATRWAWRSPPCTGTCRRGRPRSSAARTPTPRPPRSRPSTSAGSWAATARKPPSTRRRASPWPTSRSASPSRSSSCTPKRTRSCRSPPPASCTRPSPRRAST
jgi:hypothetical protein